MLNKQGKFMRTASLVLLGLGVLFILAFFASFAHGTTTSHRNSLGVVVAYDNPYVYMFGNVHGFALVPCGKDWTCTNISFQPFHRPLLYTEEVLFCGDQSVTFLESSGDLPKGPVIVTYDRQASHNAGGVGCHMVESIFELPSLEAQ